MTSQEPRARRRGEVLRRAIIAATWQELTEVGWTNLTFESVARRAGAGRASIYRHWPDRAALIAETMRYAAAGAADFPAPTGELRSDLVEFLLDAGRRMDGPLGTVARGLVAELAGREPGGATLRDAAGTPITAVLEVLRAAGVSEDGVTSLGAVVTNLGSDMVMYVYLSSGAAPGGDEIAEFVDRVWLPVLRSHLPNLRS